MRSFGLVLALLPLGGCSLAVFDQVRGSGVMKTESRKASGFTSVVGVGSEEIVIQVGKPFAVTVTGDDNIVPLIETKVQGTTLRVGGKSNYSTKKGVRVTVSMPSLASMRLLGSGTMSATGLAAKNLDIVLDGSGRMSATGRVDSLKSELNGSGEIDLTKLGVSSADLVLAGSGRMRADVRDRLDATIAGSGEIVYRGTPKVNQSVTGSGAIRRER